MANLDCLMLVFEHLSMAEKLKCRLVSRQWRTAVDRLIRGQHYLEICAVNSSLAAAAAEATGNFVSENSTYRASVGSFFRSLQQLWIHLSDKLGMIPELDEEPNDVLGDNDGSGRLHRIVANQGVNIRHQAQAQIFAQAANVMSHHQQDFDDELDVLTGAFSSSLMSVSSYYWTYAFCASSSLFSSYAFANSSVTSHEYLHSFCSCYPRERHKFSILLDRQNLSFERFHRLFGKFQNVRSLVIRNLDQLSDTLFFLIAQRCPNLQALTFTNCTGLKLDSNIPHSSLNSFTDFSWRLLGDAYPGLTSLTLRQCKLSEEQLTKVIRICRSLKYLDISDNLHVGKSVRGLGPSIECLICGDLSNDESIDSMLSNIAFGNGRHVKYLSMFGALGPMRTLVEFDRLEKLELHFYTDEELSSYLSDIGFLSLTSLVLEQIRCYESPSAITVSQFEQMLRKSSNLRRLQITGDFDWNLRLTDESLQTLAQKCPKLQELTLNGNGQLTDYGILHLSNLPLIQLSLSSFGSITDYSIKTMLKKVPTLVQLTLVDMPQITERVITRAISLCSTDNARTLNLTLGDEHVSKRVRKQALQLPKNLCVKFDSQLCGKQLADNEPTDMQMILVIFMSAIILGMTLLTTVVVVLVPLSMLLMMAHEWLFETLQAQLESVNIFENIAYLFTASGIAKLDAALMSATDGSFSQIPGFSVLTNSLRNVFISSPT